MLSWAAPAKPPLAQALSKNRCRLCLRANSSDSKSWVNSKTLISPTKFKREAPDLAPTRSWFRCSNKCGNSCKSLISVFWCRISSPLNGRSGEIELNHASGGNFDSVNNYSQEEESKSPERQPVDQSNMTSPARSLHSVGKTLNNFDELIKCFICFGDL